MKTVFDILDKIYPIVNVAAVRATLDGKVYRTSRPIDSTKRDITVATLHIAGGTDIDLQGCPVIINCYAKDIAPGIPDDANLNAMTAAVLTVIEAYNSGSSAYLHLEPISQGIMEDIDKSGISYSSIRLQATIQFNT
jgi:hypothetical protein